MSPRDFDPEVVTSRLLLIRELLDDLETAGQVTPARLREDRILRHAVERILTQLVDLAVSINGHAATTQLGKSPADYRSSFALAAEVGMISQPIAEQLRLAVGLRNVLTHEYAEIDLALVARGADLALDTFSEYVRQASRWLTERAESS